MGPYDLSAAHRFRRKPSWLTYMQPEWVRLSEVRPSAPRFDFVHLHTNTRQKSLTGMEYSQDSAFCVPTYSNSESACHGQTRDHTSGKQERASDEQVPVFQPRWRDQAQVKLEQPQIGAAACTAVAGHSTDSMVHGSDEQAASNPRGMNVSFLTAWNSWQQLEGICNCSGFPLPPPSRFALTQTRL